MNKTILALNTVSGLAHLAQIGVIYPLLALWLDAGGMPTWQIGLVETSVWLGMLIGNLFAPMWLHRLGPAALAAAGCLGSALLALLMPHLQPDALIAWSLAAALLGVCLGLRWIGVESWLYAIVDDSQRGRFVGLHETIINAAQGAGPSLIALLGVMGNKSFYAAAVLGTLAVLPLLWARIPMPASVDDAAMHPLAVLTGLLRHARRSLPIQLGLLAGVIDGVLFGMLSIYVVHQGLSASQAAFMMTVFGIGGLLLQLPLGWWSDRRGVHSATRIVALLGLAGTALLLPGNPLLAWPAAALLGSVAAGGLAVTIIAATQSAVGDNKHMALAVTEISIAFTLGSTVGPVLAGAMMNAWGQACLPLLSAVACVGLYGIARKSQEPKRA